ncbi:hypothetical protein KKC22_15690 [Myxococcota bacterium]|nr:hypothetical protein [Myxococcota bacterium]
MISLSSLFHRLITAGVFVLALSACDEKIRYEGTVCGDGRMEGTEACDDGNSLDDDGCSRFCRLERVELCDNQTDDDENGWIDCLDPACTGDPSCTGEICGNGLDDDENGSIDCDDEACLHHVTCQRPEDCDNGLDDDGNGYSDCDDAACAGHPLCGACEPTDEASAAVGDAFNLPRNADTVVRSVPCLASAEPVWVFRLHLSEPAGLRLLPGGADGFLFFAREEDPDGTCGLDTLACVQLPAGSLDLPLLPPGVYRFTAPAGQAVSLSLVEAIYEVCDNGFDDDLDGDVDCEDFDCAGSAACLPEICDNGLDDNGDGRTDCEDEACAEACAPDETCDNGLDDDLDGRIDCRDFDCAGSAACAGSSCIVHFDFGTLHRGAVAAADWSTVSTPNALIASCGGAGPDFTASFSLDTPSNVLLHFSQSGSHSVTLSTEAGPGTGCGAGELTCKPSPGLHLPGTWSFSSLPPARYFVTADAVTTDATGLGQMELQVAGPLDEWCDNGVDDNGDGQTDCDDAACADLSFCRGETRCRDGLDDNTDGWIDCADVQCMGTTACGPGICVVDRPLGALAPGHPLSAWVDLSNGPGTASLPCGLADSLPASVLSFSLPSAARVRLRLLPEDFSDPALALSIPAGIGSGCLDAVHLCTGVPAPGIGATVETTELPAGGPYYLVVSAYAAPATGRVQVILNAL